MQNASVKKADSVRQKEKVPVRNNFDKKVSVKRKKSPLKNRKKCLGLQKIPLSISKNAKFHEGKKLKEKKTLTYPSCKFLIRNSGNSEVIGAVLCLIVVFDIFKTWFDLL